MEEIQKIKTDKQNQVEVREDIIYIKQEMPGARRISNREQRGGKKRLLEIKYSTPKINLTEGQGDKVEESSQKKF